MKHSFSDEQILTWILNGQTERFTLLVNRYKDRIARLGYRLFKEQETVLDFTQDVFLKVFEHLDQFRGDSEFSLWVYRIALHTALNQKQKDMVLPLPIDEELLEQKYLLPLFSQVTYSFDEKEVKISIKAALDSLPEIYRAVLHLVYYERMKYAEVAQILDVSVNTIKSYVFRGKALLREKVVDLNPTQDPGDS